MTPDDSGTWVEYQKLVLKALEDLDESQKELQKSMNSVKVDIAMLQVKSGMWGLVGGILVAVAAALLKK